jgi:hypothetical protein
MQIRTDRVLVGLVAAVAVSLLGGGVAQAQSKGKSTQTEAVWVKYDSANQEAVVKVTKPGKGKDAKKLQRGREYSFKVKPEGSVLTRTTVTINGKKAEITDIPEGKTVNVYWRPDEKDAKVFAARKIDVIFSDEELDKRYGTGE